MRYGLPYKGSKNGIAEWIIDNLPSAEWFVDLFCGGGAVTCKHMADNRQINELYAKIKQRW
jgi:site-specific DNA-adenine methylase